MSKEPKKEIYNEVWFFYKKYINHDNSDEAWEQVAKDAKTILEKNKGDKFARQLINAVIDELERV